MILRDFLGILNTRLALIWQKVMPALFILRYKKLFLFKEAFKNMHKFKNKISNPKDQPSSYINFISFCRKLDFLMYSIFSSGKKSEIRETDENCAGCKILAKKGRECGIRTPSSRPCWLCSRTLLKQSLDSFGDLQNSIVR